MEEIHFMGVSPSRFTLQLKDIDDAIDCWGKENFCRPLARPMNEHGQQLLEQPIVHHLSRDKDDANTATDIVRALLTRGAKMICVDFDATFLSIHTSGMWRHSARELHVHVRPLFLVLLPQIYAAGMHVAVVTFSPQVPLIRDVLRLCFHSELAERFIIRGDDDSWTITKSDCERFALDCYKETDMDRSIKLPYIISAAKDASAMTNGDIRNVDTVLIDDDPKNIRHANDHGIAGICFEPKDTDIRSLCDSIKRLHVAEATKTPSKQIDRSAESSPEPYPTLHQTPANQFKSNGRKKRFSFCTPSPVMKMASYKPRKPAKLRCSRRIEG